MDVQFLSDVHLEMRRDLRGAVPPVRAPVLVLAGDVGDPADPRYAEYLDRCGEGRERVFLVAGNHEAYGRSVAASLELLRGLCAARATPTTLLERFRVHEHGGVAFLGDTLWSSPEDRVAGRVRDFSRIEGLTPARVRGMHAVACADLAVAIAGLCDERAPAARPAVVVTHHAPARACNGRHAGNELESAFWDDMSAFFVPPVRAWISGHTHQSVRATVAGVELASNCVGYPGEEGVGYDPDAVLRVPLDAGAARA